MIIGMPLLFFYLYSPLFLLENSELIYECSCLFNAVGYVLESDPQGRAKQLRALVAHVVTRMSHHPHIIHRSNHIVDSENYTEAMLGKPKTEYASWITMPNSWGGMSSRASPYPFFLYLFVCRRD